ncbi:uncharacterized protein [Prorops nasuta]|uniref:uncharacterized protein isoform X2 n=1 Tax=Prorops nasuta TaxID=863751 RepID=UPI0034CF7A6F
MGMMGMLKWLRKDRNRWNLSADQGGLNNEAYRHALQAFINRRRSVGDHTSITSTSFTPEKLTISKKNNTSTNVDDSNEAFVGVPQVLASEIFEIGWVAGTEDRYLELIFAEWQTTRISLKRYTHPECRDAIKADLEVLTEIRHPNVLLLMATTLTEDHGLVSIFEPIDCTLFHYLHEQGDRIAVQGIANCGAKLADALRHAHMRGFIHGAISSHCIYLTSGGFVKLGGWELAIDMKNPKIERMYEKRLRNEIFRWLAPELFCGNDPCKESDVYGLSLITWEMCTTLIPWNGLTKTDVKRYYTNCNRGIAIDIYDFPPLLNNLLDAGLQLNPAKRTLDINRMRRFLQRLEMQYENKEPIFFTATCANNNNQVSKGVGTTVTDRSRSSADMPANCRIFGSSKESITKQLFQNSDPMPTCKKTFMLSETITSKCIPNNDKHLEQVNIFDGKEQKDSTKAVVKSTNILATNIQKKNTGTESLNGKENLPPQRQKSFLPNVNRCRIKQILTQDATGNVENVNYPSISRLALSHRSKIDSSDNDESFESTRTSIKRLKEKLAFKRNHFFYGSNVTHKSIPDTDQTVKEIILSHVKSKDYEPHKPASHKTGIEPKQSKSPGQYDASCIRTLSHKGKTASPSSEVKDNIRYTQEDMSLFESSLWKKEKLICISKMWKDPSGILFNDPSTDIIKHQNDVQAPDINKTYVINGSMTEGKKDDEDRNEKSKLDIKKDEEAVTPAASSMNICCLKELKDALDRATDIIISTSPNLKQSNLESEKRETDNDKCSQQIHKTDLEQFYCNGDNDVAEKKRIERLSENEQSLFGFKINETNLETKERSSTLDAIPSYNFNYDFMTGFSNHCNGSKSKEIVESVFPSFTTKANKVSPNSVSTDMDQSRHSNTTDMTLVLTNTDPREKNCISCQPKSFLPRRRSLPTALCHIKTITNAASGKLPNHRLELQDSTVEDLYIDDDFGESLNVNMILLNDDPLTDDDLLSDPLI